MNLGADKFKTIARFLQLLWKLQLSALMKLYFPSPKKEAESSF